MCAPNRRRKKKQQSSKHQKKNRIYKCFCWGASFILFDIEKLACFENFFLLPGNYTMNKEMKEKHLKHFAEGIISKN